MSDPVWQHTTDGDVHVDDPSTPAAALDPLQRLQQAAAATDQPAAQAAAVALDALVKFLVTAGSEGPAQVPPQQAVAQPVAGQALAVAPAAVQPVPVVSPAEPVAAEVAPVAPVLPVAPEPIAAEPQGELVELWPSDPIADENARVRFDIDDALMPRSLALEEQLEFMENPPGWTPPVFDTQIPPTFTPPPLEPTPEPQPAPQPAPPPAAPVEDVPAPPVAPEPPAPMQAAPMETAPMQTAPMQPAPVQQAAPAVLAVPAVPVPAPPVPVPVPVQQVVPAAPVAPAAVPVQQVVPVQPVVVAVPVVAAQPLTAEPPVAPVAPAQPEPTQPAVPFWKRDVSLGKKNKKQQKPAAAAVVAAPAAPKQSVPFWKKELSLGKKKQPKAATAAAPAVAIAETAPAAPAAPKQSVPFWKKELSLGKKKQPKAAAATAVAPAEIAPVTPEAPKSVPFWKRELSLGKKRSSGPKAPKLAGAKEKIPFFKREIDLAGIANMPIGHQEGTTEGLDQIVGLRIGSSQLAAALVSNNGHAELERLARSPLKAGIVVGGEVHDTDALASALKSFFAQHKLPKRGVRIGVATNRIGVRVMEVPAVEDPKAAANAIRFRAQEVLPFALSEAVVDHVDLGEGPNDTRRVLIAFAHRGLIDQYVEACKRAKLKLAGIDFDAFALLRAVTAKRAADDDSKRSAVVALAIGHERTIFAVSDGDVCEFTRVLDWGGAALDSAIAEALEITPEEAEQVKLGLSLTGEAEAADGDLTPEQIETARRAIRDSLQLLARELVASLQFYQSRPGSLDIGDVLVTGGGAGLSGLDDELTRMLGVPVHTANPFAGVTVPAGLDVPDQSGSLAIAVGLAIEEQH